MRWFWLLGTDGLGPQAVITSSIISSLSPIAAVPDIMRTGEDVKTLSGTDGAAVGAAALLMLVCCVAWHSDGSLAERWCGW